MLLIRGPQPETIVKEFLEINPRVAEGYEKKQGPPLVSQVPVALNGEGRVIFSVAVVSKTPAPYRAPAGPAAAKPAAAKPAAPGPAVPQPAPVLAASLKAGWMPYNREVELERRLLCDTILAQHVIERPYYVKATVHRVAQRVRAYWNTLKAQPLGHFSADSILREAGNRIYGKTSYGRRDQAADVKATDGLMKARIDLWFSVLDKSPYDLPKVMGLIDMFYCKVLPEDSPEKVRADTKKALWRPDWYEKSGAKKGELNERGRVNVRKAEGNTMSYWPGLLSGYMTIPVVDAFERCGLDLMHLKLEWRDRGWDGFAPALAAMNDAFKQSLQDHNLHFSASASGTTSTLFLGAEAFASISSFGAEQLKEYLLACVAYLVGGGMHTCHEVFWTGRNAGVPYKIGKYVECLPRTFLESPSYEKWSTEFWELVRIDRDTVC